MQFRKMGLRRDDLYGALGLVLIVAELLAASCVKPKPAVTVSNVTGDGDNLGSQPLIHSYEPSHEAQVYAELWKVCHEKHLTYRVANDSIYPEKFAGVAVSDKGDYWVTAAESGPTEAAESLTKLLQGPPTFPALTFDTGKVRP
jgi:hypothetical protein